MDLTTFFAQAKQNVVVPVQKIQKVQEVPDGAIHTRPPASRKAPPKEKSSLPPTKKPKIVKSSPKHVKSPKPKSKSPLSLENSPQLDTNDPDLEDPLDADADADADADFDDVENDSQWGGDGDEVHDADSPCGSQFGDDDLAGEDLDDEPVTYDLDLEPSYAKLGAWKRRDKSTLPKPEFVGPPLTPDDDAHIF